MTTTRRSKQPRQKLAITDIATCGRALTVDDLSGILSVHKLTIYRMAREGRIPGAFHIGTALRFHPGKVAAFLEGESGV